MAVCSLTRFLKLGAGKMARALRAAVCLAAAQDSPVVKGKRYFAQNE